MLEACLCIKPTTLSQNIYTYAILSHERKHFFSIFNIGFSIPTQTGVTTQTISSTKMAIATVFMGVAAVAAAAAGALTSGPDLTVRGLTFDKKDSGYSFTAYFQNKGTKATPGGFYIQLHPINVEESKTIAITVNDIDTAPWVQYQQSGYKGVLLALTKPVPTLPDGNWKVEGFIPKSIVDAGMTGMRIAIDPTQRVREIDEKNNELTKAFPYTPPQVTCTDSDSGNDFFTKGVVSTGTLNYGMSDYCVSSSTLNEFSCTSNGSLYANSEEVLCENGCFEGACLIDNTSTSSSTMSCSDNFLNALSFAQNEDVSGLIANAPIVDKKINVMSIFDPTSISYYFSQSFSGSLKSLNVSIPASMNIDTYIYSTSESAKHVATTMKTGDGESKDVDGTKIISVDYSDIFVPDTIVSCTRAYYTNGTFEAGCLIQKGKVLAEVNLNSKRDASAFSKEIIVNVAKKIDSYLSYCISLN